MKTSIAKKIATYKFQDNLKTVYATPIGHLCLFSCFAFPQISTVLLNPYALFSLMIAILFFIGIKLNNWHAHQLNLCFIFVYVLFLVVEWLLLGIPGSSIGFQEGYSVGKGVLLEFLGGLAPLIYVGLRIFLVMPLILMTISSYRLNNIK